MTTVAVAGTDVIRPAVADALRNGEVSGCTLLATLGPRTPEDEVDAALTRAAVLVEATTVNAARTIVSRAVAPGLPVVVCSCGVPAEPGVVEQLVSGPGGLGLPAEAIGGFDVLTAATRAGAGLACVRDTVTKRPDAPGVAGSVAAAVEAFRGSAREAALAFPRTSNCSIALAFATVDLDRVEVVVRADPDVGTTRHHVSFSSPVGDYELSFVNAVDPAPDGRTSRITAWSVRETLAGLAAGVGPRAVVLS